MIGASHQSLFQEDNAAALTVRGLGLSTKKWCQAYESAGLGGETCRSAFCPERSGSQASDYTHPQSRRPRRSLPGHCHPVPLVGAQPLPVQDDIELHSMS